MNFIGIIATGAQPASKTWPAELDSRGAHIDRQAERDLSTWELAEYVAVDRLRANVGDSGKFIGLCDRAALVDCVAGDAVRKTKPG